MAIINDDVKEDSVASAILESVNMSLGEDALALNDLSWAGSYLNTDVEAPNSDWSSMKDALSEIFKYQSEQVDSVLVENNTQPSIDEVHSFRDYVASLNIGSGSDEDEDLIEDDIGNIQVSDDEVNDPMIVNRRARARGKRPIENVFRPNYSEDSVKVESNDTGVDLNFTTFEVETSTEDIFKVWDLGITDEQDDFTKQLHKALDELSLPINPIDSTPWEDVVHVSVDDLVSGMGDLSLKQDTK